MKFTLDNPEHDYTFGNYGNGMLQVNGQAHHESLIIFPDSLQTGWPVSSIEDLSVEHLAPLINRKPDVALLGTGEKQVFPSLDLRRALAQQGIQLDVMDSGAACRTYNLLVAEGRHVGAAVICF